MTQATISNFKPFNLKLKKPELKPIFRDLDELRKTGKVVEIALNSELYPERNLTSHLLKDIVIRCASSLGGAGMPPYLLFHIRSSKLVNLEAQLYAVLKELVETGDAGFLGNTEIYVAKRQRASFGRVEKATKRNLKPGKVSSKDLSEIATQWRRRSSI